MRSTVERVALRNAAHREAPFDLERAAPVVERFHRLRPWFPRDYLCLFDALALLEWLARHQLYPSWIFGVYPEPFEAHCWVQAGPVVLDDTVAHVSAFTPIMVV